MCETAKAEAFDPRDPREGLNKQAADKVRAAANAQEAGRGGYATTGPYPPTEADRALFNLGGALGGAATAGLYFGDDARRPRLRERVNNSLHHSQQAADRLQKLGELEYLLAKNPDVARILELVEETRV